jgi:tRNA (cmo5U34)-methyltransferase
MKKDEVYSKSLDRIEDFRFDDTVADVFDDMISRSVPLYKDVQLATARLASRLVRSNSVVYDFGCSTGTSIEAMCGEISDPTVKFVGVDTSAPMLAKCSERLRRKGLEDRVTLIHDDLANVTPSNASVLVFNYTLQFFAPNHRQTVVKKMADSLEDSGALLMTEKVVHEMPRIQDSLTELYYDFKRDNGYSELEISQKREALENVLVPYTAGENCDLLKRSGFSEVEIYLKWYVFVSILAIKGNAAQPKTST